MSPLQFQQNFANSILHKNTGYSVPEKHNLGIPFKKIQGYSNV